MRIKLIIFMKMFGALLCIWNMIDAVSYFNLGEIGEMSNKLLMGLIDVGLYCFWDNEMKKCNQK